jgi:hypothetical protein
MFNAATGTTATTPKDSKSLSVSAVAAAAVESRQLIVEPADDKTKRSDVYELALRLYIGFSASTEKLVERSLVFYGDYTDNLTDLEPICKIVYQADNTISATPTVVVCCDSNDSKSFAFCKEYAEDIQRLIDGKLIGADITIIICPVQSISLEDKEILLDRLFALLAQSKLFTCITLVGLTEDDKEFLPGYEKLLLQLYSRHKIKTEQLSFERFKFEANDFSEFKPDQPDVPLKLKFNFDDDESSINPNFVRHLTELVRRDATGKKPYNITSVCLSSAEEMKLPNLLTTYDATLSSLSLRYGSIYALDLRLLAVFLQKNRRLTEIDLQGLKIYEAKNDGNAFYRTDEEASIDIFIELLKTTQLRSLNMLPCELNAVRVAFLSQCNQLKKLEIYECKLDDAGLKIIAQQLTSAKSSLHCLTLRAETLTRPAGIDFLRRLRASKRILTIRTSDWSFGGGPDGGDRAEYSNAHRKAINTALKANPCLIIDRINPNQALVQAYEEVSREFTPEEKDEYSLIKEYQQLIERNKANQQRLNYYWAMMVFNMSVWRACKTSALKLSSIPLTFFIMQLADIKFTGIMLFSENPNRVLSKFFDTRFCRAHCSAADSKLAPVEKQSRKRKRQGEEQTLVGAEVTAASTMRVGADANANITAVSTRPFRG